MKRFFCAALVNNDEPVEVADGVYIFRGMKGESYSIKTTFHREGPRATIKQQWRM